MRPRGFRRGCPVSGPGRQRWSDFGLWRNGVTLTGPDHGRDPGVDRDVAGGQPGRLPVEIEAKADAGPEHQAVRRAAEVEHAKLVALFHLLSLVHGDLAGGDLGHADWKDAYEPDGRVVGLDEHHRPGGDLGDVALRVVGTGWVVSFGGSLGIVRAVVHVGFHDPAVDRAVPAVVAERAEECLVYRAAGELVGPGIVGQHVGDGVRLPLDPEPVVAAGVVTQPVGRRLAGVDDDIGVCRGSHRPYPRAEPPGEEVVPRGETVMRF